MRISSIPQIYRHLNRWREILGVLSKYELATWIGRLGPDFAKDLLKDRGGSPIARAGWECRVRNALAELGPTFIKLGQVLSTRPDLVGVSLADELAHLQKNVPSDAPEAVRELIETELQCPLEQLFAEFEEEPLASASIGQVHRARLHTGETVAVKVQHADIEQKIRVDLDILTGLAQMAQMIEEFQNYRPEAIVDEFRRTLRNELDFSRELRNMQLIARHFRDDPTLRVPRAYPEHSTSRVLTMEFIEGIPLGERERLEQAGVDPAALARAGAEIYMRMIFEHGFYHADPHPGNILVLDGGVFGLLDHGMVGRIDEALHEDFAEMLLAVAGQDAEHLAVLITRVGATPPNLDRSALTLDVADFVSHYGSQPLDRFDLSGALNEMTEMIRRYRIMLPARIAMLLKMLVTLEGTARILQPDFNLIEVMAPYQRRMTWRRWSPKRQYRKWRRLYGELEHLLQNLPRNLGEIMEQVQSGTFDVHLDHRGLEPSVNRLVLGMLASALFLGSSLLLAHKVPPVLNVPWLLIRDISSLGAFGIVLSLTLGMRLWRAISKSGHLDRRK
ncbi:MAG: AarF/ABC1/UbiB kinase family protein [Thermoguttaceae bacterium]|jgi:ubiquinone biosynthesis protein|nr:AarF/ABC1/UbiB kinase family protein [Thermoguttaceae bacterium]